MSYHNIIFTKPLGLSLNLANLLILNDYCVKNNFSLTFFIPETHLEILKKFDTIAQFIVIDDNYRQFILKENYLELGPIIFSAKLKCLIKKQFLLDLNLSDTHFYDADWTQADRRHARNFIENIPLHKPNVLVYNTYSSIELYNISPVKLVIDSNPNVLFDKINDNILSFNLISIHENKQLAYAFWDYMIENKLRQYPVSRLFFVSVNHEILQHFTTKYNSINKLENLTYESRPRYCRTNYSKTIGSSNNTYYDMINCSFTNFQSFDNLVDEFPEVRNIFNTIKLLRPGTMQGPTFDTLVNYFKYNSSII
jgi:hypothetical protein